MNLEKTIDKYGIKITWEKDDYVKNSRWECSAFSQKRGGFHGDNYYNVKDAVKSCLKVNNLKPVN